MHLLLILVLLMVAFPALTRFFGSLLRIAFWLVITCMVVAAIGAIIHTSRPAGPPPKQS
jgi:hypothetical protein